MNRFSLIICIIIYCLKNSSNPMTDDWIANHLNIDIMEYNRLLDNSIKYGTYKIASIIVSCMNGIINGGNKKYDCLRVAR